MDKYRCGSLKIFVLGCRPADSLALTLESTHAYSVSSAGGVCLACPWPLLHRLTPRRWDTLWSVDLHAVQLVGCPRRLLETSESNQSHLSCSPAFRAPFCGAATGGQAAYYHTTPPEFLGSRWVQHDAAQHQEYSTTIEGGSSKRGLGSLEMDTEIPTTPGLHSEELVVQHHRFEARAKQYAVKCWIFVFALCSSSIPPSGRDVRSAA